jgi:hypothetical protein
MEDPDCLRRAAPVRERSKRFRRGGTSETICYVKSPGRLGGVQKLPGHRPLSWEFSEGDNDA